ncbi:MAG: threonine/serine exporter family protein [Phycisphaerales bacterium]|nr:threonine/serine exporter family protein [Phycisphaerales bacterium]
MSYPTRPIRRAPRPDEPRIRFLIELSRALGTYGTSAHRLEDVVKYTASELGLECHVFSTPTSVFLSIESDTDYVTYLSRIDSVEVNLSKLRRFDALFNAVADGRMTPRTGVKKIKEIVREPDPIPGWVQILAFGVISACVAIFFGGGLREIGASSFIGFLVGVLGLFVGKRREHARLMEFLAGFIASLVAGALTLLIGPYSPGVAVIAGLIVLLPGMTITVSMTELATRNVVSGSARITGALMIFLLIGFGVAAGNELVNVLIDVPASIEPTRLDGVWNIIAALVSSLLLVILFRAKWSDAWAMVLAVFLAFYSSRFGVEHFGLQFGVCFAGVCVGVLGNLFARAVDRPSLTVTLPGLLMLVPGSVGFRSLQSFMNHDTVGGVETAVNVVFIGVALVIGILLANILVPPRKVL